MSSSESSGPTASKTLRRLSELMRVAGAPFGERLLALLVMCCCVGGCETAGEAARAVFRELSQSLTTSG